MKFNFNKAMILKNRFWIILGGSVCVILTGLFWLQSSDYAAADTEKNKKAYDATKKMKGPFDSAASNEGKQKLYFTALKSESEIWQSAWQAQENLYSWPTKVEKEYEFDKGLFATAITVTDTPPAKESPDQDDKLMYVMHGQLLNVETDWFQIKNRKNETPKFYRTMSIDKFLLAKENKQLNFQDLKVHAGKWIMVTYQKGRYFNELLTTDQRNAFADSYKSQIHDILESVDPYDVNGNGVVQLRNWLYRKNEFPIDPKFIRFVNTPWNIKTDFSKEAWVAQENLWIQKEIYRIIRKANDQISAFVEEGTGKNKTRIFKNTAFELQLSLTADGSLSFLIKNRLPKKQKLDLSFRVLMAKGGLAPELIRVSAAPLAAEKDKGGKDSVLLTFPKEKTPRSDIFSVEQVLSWESAAIKRIDHISIGSSDGNDLSHGHRTFPEALISIDAPTLPAADPNKPPPFRPGGGGGGNQGAFEHGLWANRYLEVSEQSRRVPVSIVLIVDQSHVDRVLTAFNNSHLRFLSTQVLLNQYSGSLQPPALPEKEGGGNPIVGKEVGIVRPPMGGPAGGAGGGGGTEANMELVLYGVMTLYERFPPRPPMDRKQ